MMPEHNAGFAAVKRFALLLSVAALFMTALWLPCAQGVRSQSLPPMTTPTTPLLPPSQIITLGSQQVRYSGAGPIQDATVNYWDSSPLDGDVLMAVQDGDAQLHLAPGPDDAVRWIVQLEGAPLAAAPDFARSAGRAASLKAAQSGVLRSLEAQGIEFQVTRHFIHAFNGMALVSRAGDRAAIAGTAGVRAVYPDYALQPLLWQSVPLVGAPTVWTMLDAGGLPVLGTGMRVAIIDTGIDYNHPDLGGPGFPNKRVIDGYNFVSDTDDPWDDMGHGTHIAGIVGASGTVTGVAPEADLLAYKVVDAQLGYAVTSDTIAAIERALDPDGNPGTDDSADVIVIALGSPGAPDDPLSQACDNAVNAGAVVVAAAGNSGPRYGSITSPGVADRVISAGASTKADALWTYSARGLVPGTWSLKPDLVAPGVSISSTIPGGYEYGTGTSMSAAHVGGAALLLRQLHPAWPPDWVRAALMNTAKDLGATPMVQGAGRLRVDEAAATPALLLPPSLSLGRVDGSQPLWQRQETLTLHNVSSTTLTYTLSTAGTFPAGVSRTVSPTQVSLAPGSSAPVTLSVTVDTALVPDQPADPFAYWGILRADSAGYTSLRVPFTFVKAPMLRLHVDETPVSVMFIHDAPLTSRFSYPAVTTSDHLLPSNTYSVVVRYQQPYAYIVDAVTLPASGFAELTVPRSAATHSARIAFTDETGGTGVPTYAFHRFMWSGNGWFVSEVPGAAPITEVIYFSDAPPQFTWERTVVDADPAGDAYRQWHGRSEGITGDLEFLSAPSDFARVDHPLRALPGTNAYAFQEAIGYQSPNYAYTFGPAATIVPLPYVRRAYYRTPPAGHALYTVRLAIPEPVIDAWEGTVMSPWLQLDAGQKLGWRQPFSENEFYYSVMTGGTEPLGLGPLHGFIRFNTTSPDILRLVAAEGRSLFFRAYQGGDVSWEMRQPYELWQDSALVQSGDIGGANGGGQVSMSLPASGTYTLTMPFTYTLGARDPVTAHGRVDAGFDTTLAGTDANPPFMTVLRLLENGQPVDVAYGPVALTMVISDTVDPAPVVSVAYDAGAGWVTVPVTRTGDAYGADFPGFAHNTAVNLRITATDASGNALVHTLEPAYLVRWRQVYLPIVLKNP